MLSCVSCLCMVNINPISVISFADIFFFSKLSFGFVPISYAVQKFLSFIRSHLFIFAFVVFALGGGYKNILWSMSKPILHFPLGIL